MPDSKPISEEMESCPFCGGQPVLLWGDYGGYVNCPNKNCYANGESAKLDRAAAIAAWNRRPRPVEGGVREASAAEIDAAAAEMIHWPAHSLLIEQNKEFARAVLNAALTVPAQADPLAKREHTL